MTNPIKCPHCGNTDRDLIDDNGYDDAHPEVGYMCLAPCDESECALDFAPEPRCLMQWYPNEA